MFIKFLDRAIIYFFVFITMFFAGCQNEKSKEKSDFSIKTISFRTQNIGRELYIQYCAYCHGSEGQGDGPNAYNLEVKPPDFSTPQFQNSRSDDEIEKFIKLGGRKSGKSALCPEWGKTISTNRITYLRYFIHTFRPKKETP